MKTLIIKIDNAINASKIYEVVKLFKGVKQAHLVTPGDNVESLISDPEISLKEDNGLLKAIKEGRSGKYVKTEEFLKKLRK